MVNPVEIKFYCDPGHGWGAVKRQILLQYGVADKISAYSYQKGGTVYLEEDCDLPTFVAAAAARGVKVTVTYKDAGGRSPIRNYNRYTA